MESRGVFNKFDGALFLRVGQCKEEYGANLRLSGVYIVKSEV